MLLDLIDQTLPEWMFAPARRQWSQLLASVAAVFDGLVEGVYQARLAAMPGQVDASTAPAMGGFLTIDALPFIGRDRQILRGLSERPEEYAGALRQWLQSWAQAATPWMLLTQLQRVLGGTASGGAGVLRIVSANGDWWTLDPSTTAIQLLRSSGVGGFTYDWVAATATPNTGDAHAWDWDSQSQPPPFDQGDHSRFWLITYAPLNAPYELTNDLTFNDPGVVGDTWTTLTAAGDPATGEAGVVGLSCPFKWVELVRHVISAWKAAGLPCTYAIVSFDPTAFNPTADSTPSSVPDGTWGWHARFNATSHYREIARYIHADYIVASPGGVRP